MVHTYSNGNKIYSVDMMLAYINIFKPKKEKIEIKNLLKTLEYKGWSKDIKNFYSPIKVIKNSKKFKDEYQRIENSDLRYPIIVTENHVIIDGVHRLSKAYLLNKKTINVYIFDKKLMKKFVIDKKVDKLGIHDFIKLFYEKFTD